MKARTAELGHALALAAILVLGGCGRSAPIEPAVLAPPSPPSTVARPPATEVVFPRDDAPHEDLTEWWYSTGHLDAADGRTYGFELVMFQAIRRDDPPAFAAHFAVTDNGRGEFHFAERSETGLQVRRGSGLDLDVSGWTVKGGDGQDHVRADMADYSIDLELDSRKPAVLHAGTGLISFGPAGDSYYYSRTRLTVSGVIADHGQDVPVTGIAWMDHQWGNFVSGGGGWDWFAIQLTDDTELMLFLLRDGSGKPTLPYGTYVRRDGSADILPPSDFSEQALGFWASPSTGVIYPSGWQVTAGDVNLTLSPTVKAQELTTQQSTGISYWEGEVTITGTKAGRLITGRGYVELVGYH